MNPEPKDNLIHLLQNELTKLRQDSKAEIAKLCQEIELLTTDKKELTQIIFLLAGQLDHAVVISSDDLHSIEPPTFNLGENISGELILRPNRARWQNVQ